MLNPNARAALKRVVASLLGMTQTRLELAGVELAQVRQTTVRTVVWSLLTALAAAFASLFVCILVIALAWDTPLSRNRRVRSLLCGSGVYFYVQLKDTLASQPPCLRQHWRSWGATGKRYLTVWAVSPGSSHEQKI